MELKYSNLKSLIRRIKDTLLPLAWVKRHLFSKYEPPEIAIVERMLKPNSVILDVGAHAGSWCVNFSKILPQSKIYSFEAFPVYSNALKMTCTALRCQNVEVISSAVLSDAGLNAFVFEDESGDRLTGMNYLENTLAQGNGLSSGS